MAGSCGRHAPSFLTGWSPGCRRPAPGRRNAGAGEEVGATSALRRGAVQSTSGRYAPAAPQEGVVVTLLNPTPRRGDRYSSAPHYRFQTSNTSCRSGPSVPPGGVLIGITTSCTLPGALYQGPHRYFSFFFGGGGASPGYCQG